MDNDHKHATAENTTNEPERDTTYREALHIPSHLSPEEGWREKKPQASARDQMGSPRARTIHGSATVRP